MNSDEISSIRRQACEGITALGQVLDQLRIIEQIAETPNKDARQDSAAKSAAVIDLLEAAGLSVANTQDLQALVDRIALKQINPFNHAAHAA